VGKSGSSVEVVDDLGFSCSSFFAIHPSLPLLWSLGFDPTKKDSTDFTTTIQFPQLASMQISILRLLVAGSENKTAYKSRRWSLPPSPDDLEYLASNTIDERLLLVPSGPVTKVGVAKVSSSRVSLVGRFFSFSFRWVSLQI